MTKKNVKEFVCLQCGKTFERYVPPSSKSQTRMYCNRSCQMKATQDSPGSGVKTYVCELCGTEFTRYAGARRPPFRFCTKSCSSKFHCQHGLNAYCSEEQLRAAGRDETADRLKKIRSEAAIKSNTGRVLTDETRQKISESCTGVPNALKGKTFEEFYGPERAKELGDHHSQSLLEGFATGRLTPTGCCPHTPVYRGIRLKSNLELYAIQFLEERDGLILGETLLYEPKETRVQWKDINGKCHTYTPDLYDVKNDVVYEVKPEHTVNEAPEELVLKMRALDKACERVDRQCFYLTDVDVDARKRAKAHKEEGVSSNAS